MHSRVREGALALLGVEVLNEGGEGVELVACRIPADQNLLGSGLQVQLEHALLVVHVDFDLLCGLGVGHCIAVSDLDFGAIFASRSQKSTNDTLLVFRTARGVVENREEGLRLDVDGDRRGGRGLRGHGRGRQRTREMEEVGVAHLRGRTCRDVRSGRRVLLGCKIFGGVVSFPSASNNRNFLKSPPRVKWAGTPGK